MHGVYSNLIQANILTSAVVASSSAMLYLINLNEFALSLTLEDKMSIYFLQPKVSWATHILLLWPFSVCPVVCLLSGVRAWVRFRVVFSRVLLFKRRTGPSHLHLRRFISPMILLMPGTTKFVYQTNIS